MLSSFASAMSLLKDGTLLWTVKDQGSSTLADGIMDNLDGHFGLWARLK